jgi:hypothetical protein
MQKSVFSFSGFIKNFPTPAKFREKEKQMRVNPYPSEEDQRGKEDHNMHTKGTRQHNFPGRNS